MLTLKLSGIVENAVKKKREKRFYFHQSGKICKPESTVSARPVCAGSLQVSRGVATMPAVSASYSTPRMHPREAARCPKTQSGKGVSDKVTAFPSRLKPPSLPSWRLDYATTAGFNHLLQLWWKSQAYSLTFSWWTGRPGVLQSMGSKELDTTEWLDWTEPTAQGALLSVMWQPGWEGSLGENGYMYVYCDTHNKRVSLEIGSELSEDPRHTEVRRWSWDLLKDSDNFHHRQGYLEEGQKLEKFVMAQSLSSYSTAQLHGKQMGKQWKQSQTLFLGGSKITADGDCSHEIKRLLFLGRKAMTNRDSILKSRDVTLPTKVRLVKAMVFPVIMYGCESWTIKKAEEMKNCGVG